ncbi:MAG: hypothetical protein KDA57_23285, partial [Planctomycetales bacterium]|nr:hypothetical protein [Planctomycetales bacterium]
MMQQSTLPHGNLSSSSWTRSVVTIIAALQFDIQPPAEEIRIQYQNFRELAPPHSLESEMLRCVANLTWIVVLATAVTAVEVLLEQSCFAIEESEQVAQAMQRSYEPLDLSLFRDSIHHWQMKEGRGRNDLRLDSNQVVQIAENLLKYQNADGGWPVNLDWLAVIDVSEVRKIRKNT